MSSIRISLLVFAIIIFSGTRAVFSQDARAILEKVDQVIFAPKDKQGKVKIILMKKGQEEKVREAFMMQKGTDKKLYRYTYPESQAGIATLSLPDGVMWLYMPAFGKPKKISLLAKSQAFTGTDFSYEDMSVGSYAQEYKAELLETREKSYILELIPDAEKSNYSKLILEVDKANHYPIHIDYYNKKGILEKEAGYRYRKTGKYWNAEEVTMTDLKKDHATRILMTEVIFDQNLSDEEFTVEKLVPESK